MSLNDSLKNGEIEKRHAGRQEIAHLLAAVDRDMQDAAVRSLSADRRFITAYEAALNLATVALRASGYRTRSSAPGHHFRTIQALPEVMGPEQQNRADYLDDCRQHRNRSVYARAGATSKKEAQELLEDTVRFRNEVLAWLTENHGDLL